MYTYLSKSNLTASVEGVKRVGQREGERKRDKEIKRERERDSGRDRERKRETERKREKPTQAVNIEDTYLIYSYLMMMICMCTHSWVKIISLPVLEESANEVLEHKGLIHIHTHI